MIHGSFYRVKVFALIVLCQIAFGYFVTSAEHNIYLLYYYKQWVEIAGANVLIEAYFVKSPEMEDRAHNDRLSMGNSWDLFLVKETWN